MSIVIQILTAFNSVSNFLGRLILEPLITSTNDLLSNTFISAVAGAVLIVIFKYTSNQKAIAKVRDDIKANMLALKLYKDSIGVTLRSQGKVFKGAFALLFHSIRPMAVMILPVILLLAQMSLWYHNRPLKVGEKSLLTVTLDENFDLNENKVTVVGDGFEVETGPVRLLSKNQVYWEIRATKEGYHNIDITAGDGQFNKSLSIGEGFMKVSPIRPGGDWEHIIYNPLEKPFGADSVVKSIIIDYPERMSKITGSKWYELYFWMIYFFVVSMIFALICKPFFKVRI